MGPRGATGREGDRESPDWDEAEETERAMRAGHARRDDRSRVEVPAEAQIASARVSILAGWPASQVSIAGSLPRR